MWTALNTGARVAMTLAIFAGCAEPTDIPTITSGPQKTVVSPERGKPACTIPDDHVVIRIFASNQCGVYGYALIVALPQPTDVVCLGLPRGFVIVAQHGATRDCNPSMRGGAIATTIKLPGAEESVCGYTQLPGNVKILESRTSRACGGSTGWGTALRVRWIRKNAATTPIGALESISVDGVVSGWACQPDHPALNTEVHLYANAPSPRGKVFASFRTNQSAPEFAVSDRCNGAGTYRFKHRLTQAQLRQLSPGKYQIYAHGIDIDGGPHPVIGPVQTLTVRR